MRRPSKESTLLSALNRTLREATTGAAERSEASDKQHEPIPMTPTRLDDLNMISNNVMSFVKKRPARAPFSYGATRSKKSRDVDGASHQGGTGFNPQLRVGCYSYYDSGTREIV
ncbi:hypothetical protein MRX96_042661 [Rhipicephalus microplus]